MNPYNARITATIRPLPYYNCPYTQADSDLARSLRMDFVPKIARRLPGHHLVGLSHNFIPDFVKKHKKEYPYFLKTDISKFYPSVRHRDLIVGVQVAYRDLLAQDFVPRTVKEKYLGPLNSWLKSLPTQIGIPMGSPLSAIVAPLMLIPLWLEVKSLYKVQMMVFMDDVLIMTRTSEEAAQIYSLLQYKLKHDFELYLNSHKTQSGRFASSKASFCGWNFAGGYARIDDMKIDNFKQNFNDCVTNCRRMELRAFIKRVNQKIDGFGNYYKHGDVIRQYEKLDSFIRTLVRGWLRVNAGGAYYSNEKLNKVGLRSLVDIYARLESRKGLAKVSRKISAPKPVHMLGGKAPVLKALSESDSASIVAIQEQLKQLIVLQRKQLKMLEVIAGSY